MTTFEIITTIISCLSLCISIFSIAYTTKENKTKFKIQFIETFHLYELKFNFENNSRQPLTICSCKYKTQIILINLYLQPYESKEHTIKIKTPFTEKTKIKFRTTRGTKSIKAHDNITDNGYNRENKGNYTKYFRH